MLRVHKVLEFVEPLDGLVERGRHRVAFLPAERVLGIPFAKLHFLPGRDQELLSEVRRHQFVSPRSVSISMSPDPLFANR